MNAKICTGCRGEKKLSEFSPRGTSRKVAALCRKCKREYEKKRRKARIADGTWKERSPANRRSVRLRAYGLTEETFARLLKRQGGGCAICGAKEPGPKDWHIDHDHECHGKTRGCRRCVRGLLCHACNTGLGSFRDNWTILLKAAGYLLTSIGGGE